MRFATRLILILMLALPGFVAAQEETPAVTDTAATATTTDSAATSTTTSTTTDAVTDPEGTVTTTAEGEKAAPSAYDVRNQFTAMLQNHPYDLTTILVLDPTLLTNESFVASYPSLQEFVKAHPEVQRNPRFYLAEFGDRRERRGVFDEALEGMLIFAVFSLIAIALAWLIRTIIEQKRWNRLSRQQGEVHNKILDRFGSSEELLQYIKTPAGTKFLESAPIPLHADSSPRNLPATRVVWSIQIGVVVAAGAIGMLLVSFAFDKESARDLFALGVIALCIGGGFIASAVVSLILSRRLGLWQAQPSADVAAIDRA